MHRPTILTHLALLLCFAPYLATCADDLAPQIDAAVYILSDLPESLASPFCSEYIHYHERTVTYTVTADPTTTTKTVPCRTTHASETPTHVETTSRTQSKPTPTQVSITRWVSTVTSTTTTTYHTTSTIYVAPAQVPMVLLAERALDPVPIPDSDSHPGLNSNLNPDAGSAKKKAKFLVDRATWCDGFDVPCRLVQYHRNVIEPACERFLGGGEVVTRTRTVGEGEVVTRVVEAC